MTQLFDNLPTILTGSCESLMYLSLVFSHVTQKAGGVVTHVALDLPTRVHLVDVKRQILVRLPTVWTHGTFPGLSVTLWMGIFRVGKQPLPVRKLPAANLATDILVSLHMLSVL